MKFARFCLASIALATLAAVPAVAEDPTIVVFSRHTFRGISFKIGPQVVSLPTFGMEFALPTLGYGFEASPPGITFVQKFAAKGLNEAATKAVAALGESFNGRWDEIRADLASSRNFYTGLYMREGLQPLQKSPILLTGVPTTETVGVDVVSIGSPVKKALPPEELKQLREHTPNLEHLRVAAERLLEMIGAAQGKTGPFHIDPSLKCTDPIYAALVPFASCLEMTSVMGSPLPLIFPNAPREAIARFEPEAAKRGSDYLGTLFSAGIPIELARACSTFQLQYVQSMPHGSHVIVQSHDDDVSNLCRSLELVRDDGDPDELAMYPVESFVIAVDSQHASIARMRAHHGPRGTLTGPFDTRLVWHGTRAEWDAKVARVQKAAADWKPGSAERAALKIQDAVPLNVLYQPVP